MEGRVKKIPFTKASGAGNDFVILDNRAGELPPDQAALARLLCDRHFGVGGDGLLILEASQKCDFLMKYYNADGSYGGMCGNGGRCMARYAFLRHLAGPTMTFEALDFLYRAEVLGEQVRLSMKDPTSLRTYLDIRVEGLPSSAIHFVDTGSPHLVVVVDTVDRIDVAEYGRLLRHHEQFAPAGTNVNFVQMLHRTIIKIRTYERGVEAETLACGTGSVASALVTATVAGGDPPIKVGVRSGEELVVSFQRGETGITGVTLQGSAHMLFEGEIEIDDARMAVVSTVSRGLAGG